MPAVCGLVRILVGRKADMLPATGGVLVLNESYVYTIIFAALMSAFFLLFLFITIEPTSWLLRFYVL